MYRLTAYFVAGFLALAIAAYGGLAYLFAVNVDPTISAHQRIQESFETDFLKDQEHLRSIAFFRDRSPQQANAANLLAQELNWLPAPARQPQSMKTIPRAVREKLIRYQDDWIRHHESFSDHFAESDLLARLREFDYWDLESTGPLATLISEGRFLPHDQVPVPESLEILTLAKLRLMKAVRDGKTQQALQETRHLAQLLFTTENLEMQLAAITLLELEHDALTYYLKTGLCKENSWQLIPSDSLRRAYRAISATRGYMRFWTEPATLRQIFLEKDPPIGFCSAVNASVPIEMTFSGMMESKWPFERDYREGFRLLRDIATRATQHCRLQYVRVLMAKEDFNGDFAVNPLLLSFPYSRKLFGLKLSSLQFTGFEGYTSKRDRVRNPAGNQE